MSDPKQIEADIARQREELAETVGALQDKLDVKSQAKQKAADLKDRATDDRGKPRPELAAVVGGGAILLGLMAFVRARRRRS